MNDKAAILPELRPYTRSEFFRIGVELTYVNGTLNISLQNRGMFITACPGNLSHVFDEINPRFPEYQFRHQHRKYRNLKTRIRGGEKKFLSIPSSNHHFSINYLEIFYGKN